MGLLNRILLRHARRCFSIIFPQANTQQRPPDNAVELVEKVSTKSTTTTEIVLIVLSIAFDLLDWINFALDFTFCIKLFQLPDSILYAIILLIGLILGRVVEFCGSSLLVFNNNNNNNSNKTTNDDNVVAATALAGGIRYSPFWIDSPTFVQTSKKYHGMFSLLYCVVFTETAVFLLEDYPSLSIYAHWKVINFPPVPLERFDQVNVIFSVIMLCIVLSLFFIAILFSIARLSWHSWNVQEKYGNAFKICIFITLWILLVRYIFLDVVRRAIDVVIRGGYNNDNDMALLPSNTIMGIEICEPITNFQDREEFCDEQSFLIHVAFAWVVAIYFSLYIFFRPLRMEDLDDDDDDYSHSSDNDNDIIVHELSSGNKSMPVDVVASSLTDELYALPIQDENGDDDDDDGGDKDDSEMGTPVSSNKKSPSNEINQEEIFFDATESSTPPIVVMDENKQQEAATVDDSTITVEYHEDDSSTNDGGVYVEQQLHDDEEQAATEMAATIVAAATGPTPQQEQLLLQQSASADHEYDPSPLLVVNSPGNSPTID